MLQQNTDEDKTEGSTLHKPTALTHREFRGVLPLGELCLTSGKTVLIDADKRITTSHEAPSVISLAPNWVSLTQGKWYYELTVVSCGEEPEGDKKRWGGRVGWATKDYVGDYLAGKGAGSDSCSWAVDCWGHAWHMDKCTGEGRPWVSGDVVCCAYDSEKGEIYMTLNGEWTVPRSRHLVFSNVPRGIYPVVSFDSNFVFKLNMGNNTLAYPLPRPGGFRSVWHWVSTAREFIYAQANRTVVGKLIAIDGSAFIQLEGMIYRQESRGSIGGFGFPSIALGGILLTRGKWYYETKLLGVDNVAQIGWADLCFEPHSSAGEGVGDDLHSWAYDGNRVLRWYKAHSETWGKRWHSDSIVGCLADLDARVLSFTLDGQPLGICYSNISIVGGLRPAMTASLPWASEFNFGGEESDTEENMSSSTGKARKTGGFWYPPPAGYRGVGEAIRLHQRYHDLNSVFHALKVDPADAEADDILSISQSIKHTSTQIALHVRSGHTDCIIESYGDSGRELSAHANFNYPTVTASRCWLTKNGINGSEEGGKYYFEVTILSTQTRPLRINNIAIGFVGKSFDGISNKGIGVGDAQCSWAVDNIGRKGFQGEWSEEDKDLGFGAKDTVGVLVSRDEGGYMAKWVGARGKVLGEMLLSIGAGITPAVSLVGGSKVKINFGGTKFVYTVPEGYVPWEI